MVDTTAPRSELRQSQARTGYLFIFPTMLLYLAFVLLPVIITVVLSFASYDPQFGSHWVGFDNFKRFFTDPRSVQIFWNTLRFTAMAVTGNVTVGLLLALALNRAMPGWLLYFFRLAFFLPVIIAAAFVAIVWSYFFKDNGIFNYYLAHLGLPTVRWLTSAQTAMPSIVFMDVWKNTGFFMVIFIAALQGVPKTITEAAIMDGVESVPDRQQVPRRYLLGGDRHLDRELLAFVTKIEKALETHRIVAHASQRCHQGRL